MDTPLIGYQIIWNGFDGRMDIKGAFHKVDANFDQGWIVDHLNGRVIDRHNRSVRFIIVNRLGGWLLEHSSLLATQIEEVAIQHGIEVSKYLNMPIDEIQCHKVINNPLVSDEEVLSLLQFYLGDYFETPAGRRFKAKMDQYCLDGVIETQKAELLKLKVGESLKEARQKAELSQAQLSEKTGIQKSHISALENGKFNLTLETISKISDALGMEVEILIK